MAPRLRAGAPAQQRRAIDYALGKYADAWFRHPVYGDMSFDSFRRYPGNPIHRGYPDYEWPVNGFFFCDPVSENWYVYVGEYGDGYLSSMSRCRLLRSTNQGETWDDLGVVLEGDEALFDKGGHTPDVSVVYDDGRYHLVYDWSEGPLGHEDGGIAYAWAEHPEGPFHRAAEPIWRSRDVEPMLGRYSRLYAATLLRRESDWLILAMSDDPPVGWTLVAMTAPEAEGPYTHPEPILHPQKTTYHPPLMESFPAFTHDGFVYSPATSVALNRNFVGLWRAPLRQATQPDAWELVQHGSFWHSEPTENEHFGLWGQVPAGWVDEDGTFRVMFNSRDPDGLGTVNLAKRSWSQPMAERGGVISGHRGASFACLRSTYGEFDLQAELEIHQRVRLVWDYTAPLTPNGPRSDATLGSHMHRRHTGLELSPRAWQFLTVDADNTTTTHAAGETDASSRRSIRVRRSHDHGTTLELDGEQVWHAPTMPPPESRGAIGLLVQPHSHCRVQQFQIAGQAEPLGLAFLYRHALLDAAVRQEHWQEQHGSHWRFGEGALVTRGPVKWSVRGNGFALWSPRGPEFGKITIRLDGEHQVEVDLFADQLHPSEIVWSISGLPTDFHAIILETEHDTLPVDSLDATDHLANAQGERF